jgi:frataxin-like iron-binding protein CyaY
MKLQLVNVLKKAGLLSAILLATVFTSVHAQSPGNRVTAQIPFDFNIGDRKLPSGKYSIGRIRQNSDDIVQSIDDAKGHSKAIRTSIPVRNLDLADNGKLVFHRYGDQYFLYQVWPAGTSTGRQFTKSRSERDAQQNLAANPTVGKLNGDATVRIVKITVVAQ